MIRILFALSVFLVACGAGVPGPEGPAGPAGAAGKDGTNGKSVTALVTKSCSQVSRGWDFAYSTVLFSSGDRWVSCTAAGAALGSSESAYYGSKQVGATTGDCSLFADVDTATGGYWSFTILPTPQAVYHDAGSASDGNTVVFGVCSTGP